MKYSFFSLLLLLVLLNSCGSSVKSTIDLKNYIIENKFGNKSLLEHDNVFTFEGDSFELTQENKRSGETITYDGVYEVKSGKFSDNGKEFFYLKLTFNDKSYADFKYLVYNNGDLVEPKTSSNLLETFEEDDYGLIVNEHNVIFATDYYIYKTK